VSSHRQGIFKGELWNARKLTCSTMTASTNEATAANWKNVNNWHWIEKDCTQWAHDRLKSLFLEAEAPSVSGSAQVIEVRSVEGEVSVNQRKGRVKQLFDLELTLLYKHASADTEPERTAKVTDFTADSKGPKDLDVRTTPSKEDADVVACLREICMAVLRTFVAELHEAHGKALLVERDEAGSNARDASASSSAIPSANPFASVSSAAVSSAPLSSASTTSFEEEVEFRTCSAADLFACLTEAPRIAAWSRAPPPPNGLKPGCPFELFGGAVRGKVIECSGPATLVMEWQLADWPAPSRVSLSIAKKEDGVLLELKQRGVPVGSVDSLRSNWHNYYWMPIKRTFGYGALL
jgi:activator of HSP90 ATPase